MNILNFFLKYCNALLGAFVNYGIRLGINDKNVIYCFSCNVHFMSLRVLVAMCFK